jgi:hypothetical protein
MFYYDASFVILFVKHMDLNSLKKPRSSVSVDLANRVEETSDRAKSIFIENKEQNVKINEEYLDIN